MINEKINDLNEFKIIVKRIKENMACADIYQLESLISIDDFCKSAVYSNLSKGNVTGVVDYERKMFYSFQDGTEFIIKKQSINERLYFDNYNDDDIGKFFVLNLNYSKLPKLGLRDLYYYAFKYFNYLKNVKAEDKKRKCIKNNMLSFFFSV